MGNAVILFIEAKGIAG